MRRRNITRIISALLLLNILCGASPAPRFPSGSVIDITQAPYAAVPDDNLDDSDAVQRAVTDHLGTGRFLYFPNGTYNLRKPIAAVGNDGRWNARLVFIGESREKTILQLADRAPAFSDSAHPNAMLATGSVEQQGDSPTGGGNKAFGNYILDMTLNTGSQNPGAIGIDYAVSNFGAIKNVSITSADHAGVAGISMTRKIPGPGLIKNVFIAGFDFGLKIADIQYGLTIEKLILVDQRVAGIRDDQNLLHIHQLSNTLSCPAVMLTDRNAVLTLVDAPLKAEKSQATIQSQGTVLLRNVNSPHLQCRGSDVNVPALLPIQPTPEYREPDLSQWVAVGPRNPGEPDDTAAIQRAIDAGKPVVYFVNDRTYFLSDTIVIRGAVRQIMGFGSEINLGAAKQPFSDIAHPRPLFRIDPTGGGEYATLFIEHLFFNAQYPGEVLFENNSPAAVVIKHCAGWVGADGHRHSYRNTAAATGPLFIEDVFLPGWRFTNQNVWAQQFNPENPDGDGVEPQVLNEGDRGRLWVLGFKTEGPAPFIATRNGAVTELLGAYNYISATAAPQVPADAVPYLIDNATASLTFATDNFRDNDYRTYIRVIRKGVTTDWSRDQFPPRNGVRGDRSIAVPLFRSDDAPPGRPAD